MLTEQEAEDSYLGQFIPLQYHHAMLTDANRMRNFKAAIDDVVQPGSKVLDLGGGTGALSFFAAAKAEKVWCVELNPDLVIESKRLLALNRNGDKVEVIHANAFDYLPPEPVDVVICEMIHVAMLREKQIAIVESFKQRYRQRFGAAMPIFIPTAVVMAVQPMQQDYCFEGFHAPIVQIQELAENTPGSIELAVPSVYGILDFKQEMKHDISWQGSFNITQGGTLNALRFITKNILAIQLQAHSSIDWLNRYMVLPLATPLQVQADDIVQASFNYRTGGSIFSLQKKLRVEILKLPKAPDY